MENKESQAIAAARLYYEQGLTQMEVSRLMGLSRPTVAKLITYAKEQGYVVITIHSPQEDTRRICQEIAEKYDLQSVRLVCPQQTEGSSLTSDLGALGAELFSQILEDGMRVGISWGRTMYSTAQALLKMAPLPTSGVEIIQLKGGHSHSDVSTFDLETIVAFTQATGGKAKTLSLPIFFDDPKVKQLVEREPDVACVLEAGRHCDLAVFTVGNAKSEQAPLNLGYLSQTEIDYVQKHAVGDACSRFFTADGKIADERIDQRTVGISLADLRTRPLRLLIAGGEEKREAIAAGLRMGLATHLATDFQTAKYLLSCS